MRDRPTAVQTNKADYVVMETNDRDTNRRQMGKNKIEPNEVEEKNLELSGAILNQTEEFISNLSICIETTQHSAGNSARSCFFNTSHNHAHMTTTTTT